MAAYQTLTDDELVSLLQEGNERAFTEIYSRYNSLMYIYAHKKLNSKEEAQDIIQEVLSNLWNKRYTLTLHTSLKSYLFTAVRNRALDLFAHRKVEEKYMISLQEFIDDSGVSADFLVREKDLKNLIEKEVQALPPRMREVFMLSREQRLSHREIGVLMTVSEQTVATQIKKALRTLRMRLGMFVSFFLIFLH
jgi:RNA polymerase sigma-70 factor (family 1)